MGRRLALIIGNSIFREPSLARLLTPDADVGALADVLVDPEIGSFDDVKLVVNMSGASTRRSISQFFANKTRDDLLLLYFSGHGVLDEYGDLFLATKETERSYLRGTAIPAGFITDEMDHSRSRRQVLILDCCHSGAFARGSKGSTGASVGTAKAFEGKGYGRVVLTASDATQYAWEGDQVIGEAEYSIFTHYLIEGLRTGKADADGDGEITVDELYDYAYAQVVTQTPKQTPGKWSYKEQGEIIIARAPSKEASKPVEVELPEFDDETEAKLKRLYDTGLAAYWLEEWERAARAFQAIVEARPDYPGVAEKLREARVQAELAGLYEKALAALQSEDWDSVAIALEAVVAQAPDYRDAASQLAFAQERKHLVELYAQARSLVQAEKWRAAGRVLSKIEELEPDYADEEGLKTLIEEKIAALERQKQIENLYNQALRELEAGTLQAARESLLKIQEMQPGYAESERLLVKITSEIDRQEEERRRQEKTSALYRQAQSLAQAGQWPKVLSKMEALRQISPEFEDPENLFNTAQHQVEVARREAQRQEELAALYAEAVQLIETGYYQKAADKIVAVREIDPHYPDREGVQQRALEGLRRRAQAELAEPIEKPATWYQKAIDTLREHVWLTAGASALILILVILGLNVGNFLSPPTEPPSQAGAADDQSAAAVEPLTQIGGVVSVMVTWQGAELENFLAALQPFRERTGIVVEIINSSDLNTDLSQRIDTGNPPDISGLASPVDLRNFAEAGNLISLNGILDIARMQEEYDQGFLQLGTLDGEFYGAFIKTDIKSLVWYDPKAFDTAGYKVPGTWEELNELENQIIADGTTPWCIGLEASIASGWPATDWIEDIMLRTADLQVYDDWTNQKLPWTDQAVRTAWETWGKIVNDKARVFGGPQNVLITNFTESPFPMFEDPPDCYLHRQALFITSFISNQFPGLVPGEDFNFFVLPPINPEFGTPLLIAGDLFGMFNDTSQSRALMQWLVSSEAQTIWAQQGGYLSPNKRVLTESYPELFREQQSQGISGASAVRFDASDLMPSNVNQEFWLAVQDYVGNPQNLDAILEHLEDIRTSTQ
jgi:alpha-glucoside transport system substrate-binding protein